MEGSIKLEMKVESQSGLGKDIFKSPNNATTKSKRGRPKKIGLGNAVDGPRSRKKTQPSIAKTKSLKSPTDSTITKVVRNKTGSAHRTKSINKKRVFISKPIDIRIVSSNKIKYSEQKKSLNVLDELKLNEKKSYEDFLESSRNFAYKRAKLVFEKKDIGNAYSHSEEILREKFSLHVISHIDKLNHLINSKYEKIDKSEANIEILLEKINRTEELIKLISPTENAVQLYANLDVYEERLEKVRQNKLSLENDLGNLITGFDYSALDILYRLHKQLEEDILIALENEEPALFRINRLVTSEVAIKSRASFVDLNIEGYLTQKLPKISKYHMSNIKELLSLVSVRRIIENMIINGLDEISALLDEEKSSDANTYLGDLIINDFNLTSFEPSINEILRNYEQIRSNINHNNFNK